MGLLRISWARNIYLRKCLLRVISMGKSISYFLKLHWFFPATRGIGVILMMHHIRPLQRKEFTYNRSLEIPPEGLEKVIHWVREAGYEIISLDMAIERLNNSEKKHAPFVVLTFDDAYRDFLTYAYPILKKYAAPFTLYITSGFAQGTARVWWEELSEVFKSIDEVDLITEDFSLKLPTKTAQQSYNATAAFYWATREYDTIRFLKTLDQLIEKTQLSLGRYTADNCLNFEELRQILQDPLCTIGSHTHTHPRLALCSKEEAEKEMREGRRILEEKLGIKVEHFAYPVGDPASAGQREFALAQKIGFKSAVTTRAGCIFPQHSQHVMSLPRIDVKPGVLTRSAFLAVLHGFPIMLKNRGRLVN